MELPFMDLATLAMAFPPCLSGKRPSLEVCKHEMLMAFYPCLSRKRQKSWSRTNMSCSLSACACGARNTLSFLPCLSRKSVFQGSPEALAMDFSPCLSTKSSFVLCLKAWLKPGVPSHMGPAQFNAAFTFPISSSESNLNAPRRRDAALLDNGAPTSGCCGGHRAGRSVDEFARSGPPP